MTASLGAWLGTFLQELFMTVSLLLGKRPKSESLEGRTLFRKHLSGFFGRPMRADRGWIIGNPKTAERQQSGIALENICLHLVERVSRRMANQRVIRRILKRRYGDARTTVRKIGYE